jgi:hypothetical protein
LNLKNQTVTARGRVVDVRHDGAELVVDLELWTEVEGGPTLAKGSATVALPDTSREPTGS